MKTSSVIKSFFYISPPLIKNIVASVAGYKRDRARTSGDYRKWYHFFLENEKISVDQAVSYQHAQLTIFLTSIYNEIPFYREMFEELCLSPTDIKGIEGLKKLPFLEKRQLIEQGEKLLFPKMEQEVYWKSTSGSTGAPMHIPWYKGIEQMQWGFVWARARNGVTCDNSYSSFTGLDLISPEQHSPPFWVDNWASKQRMFSIFHLNDENLIYYVQALEKGNNEYIVGYGNVMYLVADYILRSGYQLKAKPKAVFNSSVELQPLFRKTIQEAFGCPVWDHYGQVELAGAITEYDCGLLHYDMDYSILEFIPVGTEEGGLVVAEVVATNIHNLAWPLLRYRTGDLVIYHPDDKCNCGRPGRVIRKIYGRTGHYFTTPEGKKITNVTVIAKNCTNIKCLQVVQDKKNSITVKYVADSKFNDVDRQQLLTEFRKKTGLSLEIALEEVSYIERTKAGKYLAIINRLGSA